MSRLSLWTDFIFNTIFSVSLIIGSVIYFDKNQTIKLIHTIKTAIAAINRLPQYSTSSVTKSDVKLLIAPSILLCGMNNSKSKLSNFLPSILTFTFVDTN